MSQKEPLLRQLWAVTAFTLIFTACGNENHGGAPSYEIRDSAGVRIVINHVGPESLPPYGEIGAIELEIGVRDGDPEYTLTDVRSVRTTAAGGLVVAEARARELRFFDSAGLHVRTLGGLGEGPGEFSTLSTLSGLSGDTIWAWDSRNQRMTTFGPEGALLDASIFEGDPYARLLRVYRMPDGNWMGVSTWRSRERRTPEAHALDITRGSFVLRLLGPDGVELDTITVVKGTEYISELRIRGTTFAEMNFRRPFGRATYITPGPDGIVVGSNDRFEFLSYDATGSPRLLVRAPEFDLPIEAEEVSRARASQLEGSNVSPEFLRKMEATYSDFPLPEFRPAFSDIRISREGEIWLAEYEFEADSVSTWLVLAPQGMLLGRVALPPGFQIHEIGEDYLLGVWKDELGVPFVRRYALRPRLFPSTGG